MLSFVFNFFSFLINAISNKVGFLIFYYKFRKINAKNFCTPKNKFNLSKVQIGAHTYGQIETLFSDDNGAFLEIGSYCSIANNTTFLMGGNHIYSNLMTYPIGNKGNIIGAEAKESSTKGKIKIGDDVWIGTGAKILSGITVGQGAIIAAYSIVTKSIPPYAIVGGNPAKVIKNRFSDEQIEILNKIDYSKISKEQLLSVYEEITEPEIDVVKIYDLLQKNHA